MGFIKFYIRPMINTLHLTSLKKLKTGIKQSLDIKVAKNLSNGYSLANLANLNTHQKFALFGECKYSQEGHFQKYARLADIHQTHNKGLARLADIHQAVYRVLARLANIR